MDKLKDLNEMKHTLIEAAKAQLAKGVENIDTEEMGEVVDMIKDLADAEKSCMEASYYENVTEAMDEYSDGRMGYDRWRYSSGRFAPKGRGTRSGYTPDMGQAWRMPMNDGYNRMGNTPYHNNDPYGRMGYHDSKIDEVMESVQSMWDKAAVEDREQLKEQLKDLVYKMEQM